MFSSSSGENDNKGAAAGEGKPPRRQRSSDFVGPKAAKTIRGLETLVGELESERDGMKETLQRWEEKWEKLRGVKGESGKPVLEEVDEWLFGTSQSEEKE